jgi:hypothetical protein
MQKRIIRWKKFLRCNVPNLNLGSVWEASETELSDAFPPLGFADGLKPEFSSGFSAFEPNLYQRQSSRRETQFSRAETKTPKRPLQFNGQIAGTKCVHESPPVRGYSQNLQPNDYQPLELNH